MSKRPYMYKPLKKHPGIYEHIKSGRFQARKKIKGKQFTHTFRTIREAKHWKNTFDGKRCKIKEGQCSTLGEVWEAMERLHFPSLAESTVQVWKRRYDLLKDLESYKMDEITSTVINEWLSKWVDFYKSDKWKIVGRGKHARCNLRNELNLFTTILNWYKNEDEFEEESRNLTSPIRRRHKDMAFIKDTPNKRKKISVEDDFKFFSALKPLYRDLALVQFYCASRIGEVAGIQIKNIDLESRILTIKETCRWCQSNKTFIELNPFPKNRESRSVYITDELMEIIQRRLRQRWPGCNFLFHVGGKPLNYGTIQVNYRGTQRKKMVLNTQELTTSDMVWLLLPDK
ncbi:hypothetical protein BIY24_05400 [Halobacteriovorax marinus]|nr:hypothetical protein BIY24_05400 [Halobacteriovorax marinus]